MLLREANIGDQFKPQDDIVIGVRILIAMEDEVAQDALAEHLEETGYSVEKAASSIQASSLLELGQTDILIIDLYLTDEDPFEVAFSGKKRNPGMEIIGISYMDDYEKILESLGRGFASIIPRPVANPQRYDRIIYNAAGRITQEKSRENRIREAENAMSVAAILANPALSFEEKIDGCLKIVLSHLSSDRGSTLLVDHETDELVTVASSKSELVGMRKPLDEHSVATWVVRNKRPLNVEDLENIQEFKFGQSGSYKREAFLAYPIIFDGKVLGVFNVTDKSTGRFFPEDEVALSRFLGRISAVIENASLVEQIKKEREKLAIAHSDLKHLEEMKNSLISMLVHDLKSPIGEIMANLSMLENSKLDEFEKETLLMAQVGTENMLSMVMDILDVNRMEEGKFNLKHEEFDILEVVNEKIERMEALLKLDDKRMELKTEGEGFVVEGDKSIIVRVLANLVTNANNYSPSGGKITLRLGHKGGKIVVGVQDEGPGVPEEFREVIFMKFGVVAGDSKKNKFSTGLGLTFCKMAIEAHGGEIWVENAPEGGSIFYFTAPQKRA